MLSLQMLPAGCGDCLWLEYGAPPATHIVIIDGGLADTSKVLASRIEAAWQDRDAEKLDIELLVVTHIDEDHILGIIDLLKDAPPYLNVKEVWFNGRPQLMKLPTPDIQDREETIAESKAHGGPPADFLGGGFDEVSGNSGNLLDGQEGSILSTADLLGPQQGDDLSILLEQKGLTWNRTLWDGNAVAISKKGTLPAVTLDGLLKLTVLGPTPTRLHRLCEVWTDVLGGKDERSSLDVGRPDNLLGPSDLLGKKESWPPVWKEGEKKDPSAANGSSIMLLAEYGRHALLLAGDGHAPDLASALDRLRLDRQLSLEEPFPISAFKLPHHGSARNLTRDVIEKIDCCRYLISTDGSASYHHPDHQALLRVLRYSKRKPELIFNYEADTTRPWRDSKEDVVKGDF